MLDKSIVISNLRRLLTGGGAGSTRPSTGQQPPCNDNEDSIPMSDRKVTTQHLAPVATSGLMEPEGPIGAANINNVNSSANLLSYEEQNRTKNLRSRMRSLSERLSLTDEIPLPSRHRLLEKIRSWISGLIRIPILLILLYFFVCSLDFLSTAFRLIAGKTAGTIFQSSTLLANPIVGLMIAILFTVLVQSSSTCTSVIVSLVSSDILDVRMAIPMVMGANIGTSLTSTLVSLTQVTNKSQFERAFAGATVHDCFNWLTVAVLLFLETTTGYLFHLTSWLTQNISETGGETSSGSTSVAAATNVNILGALTKPLTKRIIQIDKDVLQCWGMGECQDERLLKIWCSSSKRQNFTEGLEGQYCKHLLNVPELNDLTIGIILLIISLVVLSVCLVLIVKVLSDLLKGTVADMIRKTINADIPYVPWLTGYIAIIMGAILTFIVQSSSVFTTTLTPLVGVGLITVDRVYPLTLGSNLGTTTTAMIASLAAEGSDRLRNSLQIALCHFFFNLTGILLFYPIPFMRWPLVMCKIMGRTTAEYRWFAVAYLIIMFFLLPGCILGLSMAGPTVLFAVAGPVVFLGALVIIINVLQAKLPQVLPPTLRNWTFLPLWMRSLEPTDALLRKMTCNFFCCSQYDMVPDGSQEPVQMMAEAHPTIVIAV